MKINVLEEMIKFLYLYYGFGKIKRDYWRFKQNKSLLFITSKYNSNCIYCYKIENGKIIYVK